MDLVSVIIPFHKGLHYLKDCLDSLMEQSYRPIEVILVRQNPDEAVTRLIRKYENEGLPIQDLEAYHTQGVAAARNLGCQASSGYYVYFLDSDDYILNDTIQRLVHAARDHNGDLVFGSKEFSWFKRDTFLLEHTEKDSSEPLKTVPDILKTDMSTLHILMRKGFLTTHSLTIKEDYVYYSDEVFLTELLSKQPNITLDPKALYVKRYHNDPVTLPSLNQLNDENKALEYIEAYRVCRAYSIEIPWLCECIEYLLCKYILGLFYTTHTIKFPKLDSDTKGRYIHSLQKIDIGQFSAHTIQNNFNFTHGEQNILKKLKKGKVKAAGRLAKYLHFQKKKKGVLGSKVQWYRIIDRLLFRKLPIKENWIFFESFLGKNYNDSCKYIYEYLFEQEAGRFRFIWSLQNKKKITKGKPTVVKHESLLYFYYTSRCKYWVNNTRQPLWFQKRPGMVFLETWHGTPLKKLVFDMDDVHFTNPYHKRDFYQQSRLWDYLISDNRFSTNIFERAFLFDKSKILELGYPRNDVLYRSDKEDLARSVRERLHIPPNVKTILYAPTWRDDDYHGLGRYKFTLALDIGLLQKTLGNEYVILLRTHYYIADQIDISGKEDFIKNVSHYDDVGELYLISDICITDYSSVFFDYANLKRPILFYVYDLKKYKDVLRGFYIDMENDLPGPLLYTTEEIIQAIQNIDGVIEEYHEKYEAFYQKFCYLSDGHASERVVKKVFH